MPKNVIIIGAGLSGCLLAVYLARRGEQVRVYERRPDPRAKGYVGGRSINLALSARGLRGLAGVGLDALVLDRDAIAMPGRMLHDTVGATRFQPYSKNPAEAINSVSRGGLNLTLLKQAASHPNVQLVFDHACEDVDLDAPAAILKSPAGVVTRVGADVIIGADGAFSPVRSRLQKPPECCKSRRRYGVFDQYQRCVFAGARIPSRFQRVPTKNHQPGDLGSAHHQLR